MRQYSIAVCDDEHIIRQDIEKKLKNYNKALDIHCFESGTDLLNELRNYVMVLLDIEMPGIDGMTLARELRHRGYKGEIVFLTSHTEYIQEAFKVRAFRFLNKPVNNDSLVEAVENAIYEADDIEMILITEASGETVSIKISDIVCLETFADGIYIYTIDKNRYEVHQTMKHWLKDNGSDSFFQIHKSYCINMRNIIKQREGEVLLEGMEDWLPVARRRIAEFKRMYIEYIRKYAR